MSDWRNADTEGNLVANHRTGTYFGCSQSTVRNTKGRLFSTDLSKKPAAYYCIAWSEL